MWYFHNTPQEFTPEDAEGYFGFVYLITHTPSGRRYVGKKFFTKSKTKQVKGKKKTEEDLINEGIKEIDDLIKWFGFLYFPKKEKYSNYSIDIAIEVGGKTTNKKVEFLDPFYRDNSLVKEKGCVNVLHLNENHTEDYYSIEVLPGEFIKVYIACFDKDKMKGALNALKREL